MATRQGVELAGVLESLTELASSDDLEQLHALQTRARTRRLRVLVVGESKRGKSTLVNRLLGTEVLPTGVVPVTAIATTVRREQHGRAGSGRVSVEFADGRHARLGLDALAGLVTERQNPCNEKGVARVEIVLGPGPLDEFDVELVDTPGTGSVFAHNTATAREAYESLDAAIFVVTADPPISAAERDLLGEITTLSVRTVVFLNKADQLSPTELAESVQFTREVCEKVAEQPVQVFAGSARSDPPDPGYAEFAAAFRIYLASSAERDVERALVGRVGRLVSSLLDATQLAQRSVEMVAAGSRDRVTAFAARLQEVRAQQHDLDDRGWALERGLRRSLDASAAHLREELTDRCRGKLTRSLQGPLGELRPEEMEERGRAVAAELIEAGVDRWREEQAATLDAGLQDLWRRVVSEHERQMADLRDAARELLDLELAAQAQAQRLASSRGFWYMFECPPLVELPFAATARRLAPGRARRVRVRLLEELTSVVDRQVGRARADLQERLQEGMRRLLGDLRRTQVDLLGRLEQALTDADKARGDSAEGELTRANDLSARVTRLLEIYAQLDVA